MAPSLPPQSVPSTPRTEMPAMPPAVPAEAPPAEFEPAESMPVPPSSEASSDDDLFSAPAPEAVPPPAAEDDLFGPSEPAEESAPAPESADEAPVDDFFGPPAEEAAPPAEEEPPATEEEDDLFGNAGSILSQPGGLASVELRQWNDNTGHHSCRGRMIKMLDGKVQLLKDNGRTSTVPFSRLSSDDMAFVHRQASAKRSEAIGQTVVVNPIW